MSHNRILQSKPNFPVTVGATTAELDRDGLLVDGLARKPIATSRILAALNQERHSDGSARIRVPLDDVKEPDQGTHDAIVALTAIAICGADLHMIRETLSGMRKGTILGHEGIGSVGEIGKGKKNYLPGDRVVILSTIGCGNCGYCRAGYYAQCDHANPNGRFPTLLSSEGPKGSGVFDGLRAEKAAFLPLYSAF